MSLYGVGLDIEVNKINTQIKILIQKKGGVGNVGVKMSGAIGIR